MCVALARLFLSLAVFILSIGIIKQWLTLMCGGVNSAVISRRCRTHYYLTEKVEVSLHSHMKLFTNKIYCMRVALHSVVLVWWRQQQARARAHVCVWLKKLPVLSYTYLFVSVNTDKSLHIYIYIYVVYSICNRFYASNVFLVFYFILFQSFFFLPVFMQYYSQHLLTIWFIHT